MFRRFGVWLPMPDDKSGQTVRMQVRGEWKIQSAGEILIPLDTIARIVSTTVCLDNGQFQNLAWIVMRDGTAFLSSIEYNFLAEALDGLKL